MQTVLYTHGRGEENGQNSDGKVLEISKEGRERLKCLRMSVLELLCSPFAIFLKE